MPKTSKKSREIQKDWEEKISRAKKVKKNWMDLFKVELARDYFDGKQKDSAYSDDDWITVNNIYSHIKAQLPALYSADPYFYVTLARSFSPDPRTIALYELRGKIRSAMLNYQKNNLKLKTKIRMSIQDAMFAFGACKIRYAAEVEENETAGQPILAEDGETELTDDTGNPLLEPETIPTEGRYEVSRIHSDDILWDEDAGPLEDSWDWIAHRVRISYDDALENRHYSKSALKFLKGTGEAVDEDQKKREDRKKGGDVKGKTEKEITQADGKSDEPTMLTLWEIYKPKKKDMANHSRGWGNPDCR